MRTHEIPRNYKGEGRILYIFSTKGLIYTTVGAGVGLLFYFIFKMLGLYLLGFIFFFLFAAFGFQFATLKVPETTAFEITKKTGGENIDNVIMRWIKFKKNNNKIYVYNLEEETKDE